MAVCIDHLSKSTDKPYIVSFFGIKRACMTSPLELGQRVEELRHILNMYMSEELSREQIPFTEELSFALQGGKGLRGLLALIVATVVAGDPKPALPVAMAVELMHAASLIHDDVVDEAEQRRGRESFWKRFGLDRAIIFPHVVIATAIKYVAKAGAPAVVESMEAWRKAAIGQIWDTDILKGRDPRVSYLDVISNKTGAVFEAAAVLPLYAANSLEHVEQARLYGLSLGRSYQILDDVSDYEKGVYDSGSTIQLVRESQGDPLDYAIRLFSAEIDKVLGEALKLSEQLAFFARYSLEQFLNESSGKVKATFSKVLVNRWSYWGLPGYQ